MKARLLYPSSRTRSSTARGGLVALRATFISIILTLGMSPSILAVAVYDQDFYSSNGILFYNPDAKACSANIGGATPIGTLPSSTLARIASEDIDGRVAKTKARYVYAEQQTKVPWQILAAIHYREAGLNPNRTLADGEALKDGKSIDGADMSTDVNKDAALAAQHLIDLAKMFYKVDITQQGLTVEQLGNSFLAYNRGGLYIKAGNTYDNSPYVMNGFDDAHMNMSWSKGDTVTGKDGNLGALVIYSYLAGKEGTSSSTSSSGCASYNALASTTCDVTAPITGAGGNSHQLTASELTRVYGQAKSSAEQVTVDFLGKNITVHKKVAGCLTAVANEIKANNINYSITQIGGFREEKGGGNVKDGESYHQYGAAIDINPSKNPWCDAGKVCSHDIPDGYVAAFLHHGWSWGGSWTRSKDYMHFEFNGIAL